MDAFQRTELLLGAEKMRRLREARVAVFGGGGVCGGGIGQKRHRDIGFD